MKYFALDDTGFLWFVGDCGDFDCAEEIATDLADPAKIVWIADEIIAAQWQSILIDSI
jgi:hypothetical protein